MLYQKATCISCSVVCCDMIRICRQSVKLRAWDLDCVQWKVFCALLFYWGCAVYLFDLGADLTMERSCHPKICHLDALSDVGLSFFLLVEDVRGTFSLNVHGLTCEIGWDRLWPNRLWPSLISDYGQIRLWPNRLWPEKFHRLWPTLIGRLWPTLAKPAPMGGAPMGGGPKPRKSGAQKGGAQKGGGPNILRFFFPFPPPFRCFCVSLGVFSWNFGGVLKRRCPELCMFGVLGLSCASPGGPVW